uniref:lipase family protein n=1 Tax=Nocardia pseudovaccinii TaxID=189540 RepID=UPI001FE0FC51|nr:lipase family protein [Nocardia pseudovaccinii]
MPAGLNDSLYVAPADLAAHAPGDVLQVRTMPPPLGFLPLVSVTQIQFASTDSLGRPIAAVATVMSPPNRGTGPLMVFDHTVNALGLACAPSKALWSGDPNLAIGPALQVPMAAGWTVVFPDHLGPKSAYGAAKLGGQITLDAARAAQRLPELQVGASPVLLSGYSGGAMAAAWAASLAPTYAPELDIRGAAIGGTPTNLEEMAAGLGLNPHPAFGLAFAAALGLEREYGTQMPLSDHMNPAGLSLRARMANACTDQILSLGANLSVGQLATDLSLWDDPDIHGILRANSLEFSSAPPQVPIFAWSGDGDVLIARDALERTLGRWRSQGVPVAEITVPGDHIVAAMLGLVPAVQWLFGVAGGGR